MTGPDSETRIWMFLWNVNTKELFQERKIYRAQFVQETFKISNIQERFLL